VVLEITRRRAAADGDARGRAGARARLGHAVATMRALCGVKEGEARVVVVEQSSGRKLAWNDRKLGSLVDGTCNRPNEKGVQLIRGVARASTRVTSPAASPRRLGDLPSSR